MQGPIDAMFIKLYTFCHLFHVTLRLIVTIWPHPAAMPMAAAIDEY